MVNFVRRKAQLAGRNDKLGPKSRRWEGETLDASYIRGMVPNIYEALRSGALDIN